MNQYLQTRLPLATPVVANCEFDPDGNLTNSWAAGDMNCDGVVNYADISAFLLALEGEAHYYAVYPNCNWLNADCNGDGLVNYADLNPFIALLGGNGALALTYTWDAENRLVAVEPTAGIKPPAGAQKAEYAYDYLGRRVEKKVWVCVDPNATPPEWELSADTKFVWSGWLILMELDPNNNVVRKYTWGLDLAGQSGNGDWLAAGGGVPVPISGAGGIGGLLAVSDTSGMPGDPNDDLDYVYTYDANGNVGQLVDLAHDPNDPAGAIVAKYEYDPYGRNLLDPGDPNVSGYYADENPFHYSTKYFDAETGLSYFGGRYYHPGLGRWINRDPIGELGGANLYAYVVNDPVNQVDPLGEALAKCRIGVDCPEGGHCPKTGGPPPLDPKDPAPVPPPPEVPPGAPPQPPDPAEPIFPPPPPPGKVCDWSQAGPCAKPCRNPQNGGVTMCDGRDNAMCCVCPDNVDKLTKKYDRRVREQAKKCIDEHEASHVAAGNRRPPGGGLPPCFNKPAGANPGTGGECAAYAAEFACLSKPDESCAQSPKCMDDLHKLISDRLDRCIEQCGSQARCLQMSGEAHDALRRRQQPSSAPAPGKF